MPTEIDIIADRDEQHASLPFLPYDVLIRIISKLVTEDILSCSLVCKLFNDIALHPSIWAHILQLQWNRGRRCIVDGKSSGKELRRDIIRSLAAERSWRRARPKCKSVQRVDLPLKLDRRMHYFTQLQSNLLSRRIFLPSEEQIVEYDILAQKKLSRFLRTQDVMLDVPCSSCCHFRGSLYIPQIHYSTLVNNDNGPDRFAGLQPSVGVLEVLPLTMDEDQSQRDTTTKGHYATKLSLDPRYSIHTARILDAQRRILLCTFTCDTGLLFFLIFDWERQQPFTPVNSGLSIDAHDFIIDFFLCDDDQNEYLVVRYEDSLRERRIYYSLADMRPSPIDDDGPPMNDPSTSPTVNPVRSEFIDWYGNVHRAGLADATLIFPFTLTNDWELDAHVGQGGFPLRSSNGLTSTFLFYKSIPRVAPAHRQWFILHHYMLDHRPLSAKPTRKFISLVGPRLGIDKMPITCLSMNHIGWIEERETNPRTGSQSLEGGWRPLTRLVFMLVTLPEPLEESTPTIGHDLRTTARELDIPDDVLQRETNTWMNPAMGTITIVTHFNRLNVYSY